MGIILSLAIASCALNGVTLHLLADDNRKKAKAIYDKHSKEIEIADKKLEEAKSRLNGKIEYLGLEKKDILLNQFTEYIDVMKCFVKVKRVKKNKMPNFEKMKKTINLVSSSLGNGETIKRIDDDYDLIIILGVVNLINLQRILIGNATFASYYGATGISSLLSFIGGGAGIASIISGGLTLGGIAIGGGIFLTGLVSSLKSKNALDKAIEFEKKLPSIISQNEKNCKILDGMSIFVSNWGQNVSKLKKMYRAAIDDAVAVIDNNSKNFMNRLRKFFRMKPIINYKKLSLKEQKKIYKLKELSSVLYEVVNYDVFDKKGNVEKRNYEKLKYYANAIH